MFIFFILLPNQWFLINHDELIQTQTIIFTVQKNKVDLNVVLYFSTTLGKRDGMISCRWDGFLLLWAPVPLQKNQISWWKSYGVLFPNLLITSHLLCACPESVCRRFSLGVNGRFYKLVILNNTGWWMISGREQEATWSHIWPDH